MSVSPIEIIRCKRDGNAHTSEELAAIVAGASDGSISDYQLSAWLMAAYLRGLDDRETAQLTEHMLHSGTVLKWGEGPPCVDKHSTGGVGDKVSIILAPLLACCDVRVPMLSGRGLGSTGGTLDKLDAIPGFNTQLSATEMQRVCDTVGCVMCGATAELVPADKHLYALRDVTATVESIPLITASILSKKLAEGLAALVLDVKWGSGAFMQRLDNARKLAQSLVKVGRQLGLPTIALLTDMNQPLGHKAGHTVELQESYETLQGAGPADVRTLTLVLGAELLVAVGVEPDVASAQRRLAAHLDSGLAWEKFVVMCRAQGGDATAMLRVAPEWVITAPRAGYLNVMDTQRLGRAITALGGGRIRKEHSIDHSVGLEMLTRLGDRVERGQPLLKLFAQEHGKDEARRLVDEAIIIGDEPDTSPSLIVERIA